MRTITHLKELISGAKMSIERATDTILTNKQECEQYKREIEKIRALNKLKKQESKP